jgi:anhydro-N-acetylmuramic acid kinase
VSAQEYFIGLMSGTSMDGIDAALVEFSDTGMQLRATYQQPWPASLQQQLRALTRSAHTSLHSFGQADSECGEQFALASLSLLQKAGLTSDQIEAIGSHGQTLYHSPHSSPAFTIQIGDPNRIVQLTGITTIADFRRRDIASGGQGAPLVPAFHQAIFQRQESARVILNIGGISNITLLPAQQRPVIGFDTGPGNCLLDYWVNKHSDQTYDKDGVWAANGSLHQPLLDALLDDDYFRQAPPKSTGTEYFSPQWLESRLNNFYPIPAADVQATLVALTAHSIADMIRQHATACDSVLVCGGGVHNSCLMQQIGKQLPGVSVASTETAGVDPDWVEAQAFAWLARETLAQRPGNLPSATGASEPVILGGIYPAG